MSQKNMPHDPDVIPLEEPLAENKPLVCRMCFARKSVPDAPCPSCGFDERAGLTPATQVGKRPLGRGGMTCASCGYNLQGLPSLRCPECGTIATAISTKDRYREDSRQTAREAYRTPLLMTAIGGSLLALVLFLQDGPGEAFVHLLSYIIQVPIGVSVFLLCCLIWIGFDAPVHLTALRLTGIYMVVDLTAVLGGYIPIPFAGWLIAIGLYVGLLSEMLELELMDAVAVGLITFFAKIIAAVLLIAALTH